MRGTPCDPSERPFAEDILSGRRRIWPLQRRCGGSFRASPSAQISFRGSAGRQARWALRFGSTATLPVRCFADFPSAFIRLSPADEDHEDTLSLLRAVRYEQARTPSGRKRSSPPAPQPTSIETTADNSAAIAVGCAGVPLRLQQAGQNARREALRRRCAAGGEAAQAGAGARRQQSLFVR